jgi:hypothetical protein
MELMGFGALVSNPNLIHYHYPFFNVINALNNIDSYLCSGTALQLNWSSQEVLSYIY